MLELLLQALVVLECRPAGGLKPPSALVMQTSYHLRRCNNWLEQEETFIKYQCLHSCAFLLLPGQTNVKTSLSFA